MTKSGRAGAPRRRSRPRNTRNRPTDDQLLDAARAVISEFGVERSTMDMIAERGGTTRVTLYAHFGSRDALVDRLIERELGNFTDWMSAAYAESDDWSYGARARHSVEATFEFARSNPEGLRLLLGHRQEAEDPGRRLYKTLEPRVAARLRQNYAARGAEIDASADTLASLLIGISLDVAYRALIVDRADIDIACEIAVTATLAVLREVSPEQLLALDASLADRDGHPGSAATSSSIHMEN
ncbi:TetR family transcriptional regulator [Gordonia sp. HNM0687]|uniref:TetR family transcriptional regulator n=1 Tax=Gordonia mangrovi TaxID=2665643 RepID=A0A6L7GVZ8_9ACTN|nr:TetR/AcrR family transcriptional regulator [Gordonia mangrovi]MXP23647.1 TetR family transcriptional regulator [Gordonia mangrovi]UVF79709.1 TetR/AcrR family transcriptional regulator [Gordonia mangrovi]